MTTKLRSQQAVLLALAGKCECTAEGRFYEYVCHVSGLLRYSGDVYDTCGLKPGVNAAQIMPQK